jgi:nucleoside-diphosphate-sugar epimerase
MLHNVQTVLVTGSSGFIGANVVRQLVKDGKSVIAGVRKHSNLWRLNELISKISLVEIDLLEPTLLHKVLIEKQPDIVINCAAYGVNASRMDPDLALKNNVFGTNALFSICTEAQVKRFVHIGTAFEYGNYDKPIQEHFPLNPIGVYGSTKAALSILLREQSSRLGLPLVILRLFGVFGPLEGNHKLIPQVIRSCITSRPLQLTSCMQVRDFSYVVDVAKIISRISFLEEFPNGKVINVGSGNPLSLRKLALSIAEQLKNKKVLQFGEQKMRSTHGECLVADISKLKKTLNDIPQTSLKKAVNDMVASYQSIIQNKQTSKIGAVSTRETFSVKSITLILCVYNEISRAPKALDDLLGSLERRTEEVEILVIDNSSTDGTREWMKQLQIPLVKTVFNEENLGKGGSIKRGIQMSKGDYVVIHDPDLEYLAEDIWPALDYMIKKKAAMALGSRIFNGKIHTQYIGNYLGVVFLSKLTGFLYSSDLSDTATALKLFQGPVLRSLKLVSNGFDLDFELVTRILRSGHKIVEYPIRYYPRSVDEGKKIKAIDGLKALKVILRDRFLPGHSICGYQDSK